MQILRKGAQGQDVTQWQNFLRGLNARSSVVATGAFDIVTELETKAFQKRHGLVSDGVVGPKTLSVALQAGYPLMHDPVSDIDGPDWPPKPQQGSLSHADREKLFGNFTYIATPTIANPEAITITGQWLSNVTQVHLPQISNLPGAPGSAVIPFHVKLAPQLQKLFKEWDDAGLRYLLMTWGGSWSPRFIRGSRTVLSNHAWGTAFDINVQWNQLGAQPALRGAVGSVRELVEIAYENGFYWGGWFAKRPDGMHFEAYKIL